MHMYAIFVYTVMITMNKQDSCCSCIEHQQAFIIVNIHVHALFNKEMNSKPNIDIFNMYVCLYLYPRRKADEISIINKFNTLLCLVNTVHIRDLNYKTFTPSPPSLLSSHTKL